MIGVVREGRLFRVITHHSPLTTHNLTLAIVAYDAQLRQQIPHETRDKFFAYHGNVHWQDFCALIVVLC